MQKEKEYSIGVVTYVNRFEDYFKPLIKQLVNIFPDKEIVCYINGHPDTEKQINYLKSVTNFLSQYKNVRYVTNESHQPLAKCWNWLLLLSYAERVLVLNDDLKVDILFRKSFESNLLKNPDFFVINGSWSHFLISKGIIRKVGWFEERLAGCGDEDGDYMLRMADNSIDLTNVVCYGIVNYVAPQTDAGWQKFSESSNKRAKFNEDFIKKKWFLNYVDGEDKKYDINYKWNDAFFGGTLKDGMQTPQFYSLDSLNNIDKCDFYFKNKKVSFLENIKLIISAPYYFIRKKAGIIIRKIKSI